MSKLDEIFERLKEYANYDNVDDFVALKKALLKAIDMLDLLDSQVCFLDDRFTKKTKEEWKEWLFEDERNNGNS